MDPRDKLFKRKKKASHTGLFGQLEAIEEPLLHYVFELRKQGIVLNTFTVALRAFFISLEFPEKSFTVGCSMVKRWLVAHSMRYRRGTHIAQHPLAEVESEALNYMNYLRHIVLGSSNRNRCFILNMDQMPVYFSINAKRMLELIGKKTIHICTSTNDTKRATMAVTIAADGMLLPLMVVFKEQPKGKIARTKFSSYPTTNIYH
jgi:hypothetical protein